MKKISTLSIIVIFALFCKPSTTYAFETPFTASPCSIPAKLIEFKGSLSNNKVMLQWSVKENETADQFVVEKSTDGQNFSMAALVFGTDKSAIDHYMFYEKASGEKIMYRIMLINKDHKTEYSSIISVDPVSY